MMSQTNSSLPDLSPEDAERFAAAFRPSWEMDEPNGAAAHDPIALGATLPLGAAAPQPVLADASSKRAVQKTLLMAPPAARTDASGPLPSFDLPVSAAKLPPSAVSESDVAKTALYKQVNAADVNLPDDDFAAPKKKNNALFIGIGIAAALAIAVGVGVGMSQSGDPPKTSPSAQTAPPKPTADIPPPPPATAETKAPEPGMNAAKTPATAETKAPEPGMNAAKTAAKPELKAEPTAESKVAVKPEPKAAAPATKPPAAGAAPAAPAKPPGKPAGGIVRDAPF
jgi:hypothetical protein